MAKESQIHVRVTDEEKEKIRQNAERLGFRQISEYLRFLGLLQPTYNIDVRTEGNINITSGSKISLQNDNVDDVDWNDQSLGEKR